MKRQLTTNEEFELMLLVLDKILWLGFGVMAYGLYKTLSATVMEGLWYLIAGLVVLVVFIVIVVREYEVIKTVPQERRQVKEIKIAQAKKPKEKKK